MVSLDRPEARATGRRPTVSQAFQGLKPRRSDAHGGSYSALRHTYQMARIPALKKIRSPPTSRARSSFHSLPNRTCRVRPPPEASCRFNPGIPRKLLDQLPVSTTSLHADAGFVQATARNAKSGQRSRSKREGSPRGTPTGRAPSCGAGPDLCGRRRCSGSVSSLTPLTRGRGGGRGAGQRLIRSQQTRSAARSRNEARQLRWRNDQRPCGPAASPAKAGRPSFAASRATCVRLVAPSFLTMLRM